MDSNKKKIREKSNKKWTDEETKNLLEFLIEHQELEKPTAQIFYKKFLEWANMDATWIMVKWKVKHMKSNYQKAETWRNSTGAGLLESDEGISSVKEKLHKMCRFYEQLHEIFGQKNTEFPFCTYDSATTSNMSLTSSLENENEFTAFEALDDFQEPSCSYYTKTNSDMLSVEILEDPVEITSALQTPILTETSALTQATRTDETDSTKNKAVQSFATKLKKSAPKNAVDQLSAIQIERTSYLKLKVEFDKERFEKEFKFNERKFEEEVEIKKEELNIKKLEIEKDERIKKLEIEKQERIERFAIEMKYKYTKS